MLRFMGMAISTALVGVVLQFFFRCKFDHARRLPEGVYGACDIPRFGDGGGIWIAGEEVVNSLQEWKVLVVITAGF